MDPVTISIISYVALKFVDQFIKEEGYGRVKRALFPKKKYSRLLTKIIYETIEEFEKSHPKNNENGTFPFYDSQIIFEELSKHILFKTKRSYAIIAEFEKNPNIIVPTKTELTEFYKLFSKNVKANSELKKLHFEENYKSEIFEISSSLGKIARKINKIEKDVRILSEIAQEKKEVEKSQKLTTKKVLEAMDKQVKRQLKKQLSSGKYLPNTFIETGDQKDHLRYLCDPIFYAKKCFNEIKIMDFRLLNQKLVKSGLPEFSLEWDKKLSDLESLSCDSSIDVLTNWYNHLKSKSKELKDIELGSHSAKSTFEYKFRDRIDDLNFLKARIGLITETAGQGKTNFICDFTDNFLLNRNIPTLFFTGVEINEIDIRKGILKSVFPDTSKIEFSEFIECVRTKCYEESKFLTIIIDGINENRNTKKLNSKLEQFISEILDYDFVRIVLTCRTEYFEFNFSNLLKASFSNDIVQIDSLINGRPDDAIREKLLDTYIQYFNLSYKRMSREAHDKLVSNFLLLRIFCETYRDQKFDFIDDIYKEELFGNYYKQKCDEINQRMSDRKEYDLRTNFDITDFLNRVVNYMIINRQYVNVPLDDILDNSADRAVYIRFLDENILIKRDPLHDEIFGMSEVVNFTFDEFRDYLISKYLVNEVFISNREKFELFLNEQLTDKTPILEGCSTFLFFESRKKKNEDLKKIIDSQPWFDAVFITCIFKLKDSSIINEDVLLLLDFIKIEGGRSKSIIWNLILRYDIEFYEKLNIKVLLNFLQELDQSEFEKYFVSTFGDKYSRYNTIDQDKLVDDLGKIIDEKEFEKNISYHNLIELLLYMFTNQSNWWIVQVYEKYYYQNKTKAKLQLKDALRSKNTELVKRITEFITEYEISL